METSIIRRNQLSMSVRGSFAHSAFRLISKKILTTLCAIRIGIVTTVLATVYVQGARGKKSPLNLKDI